MDNYELLQRILFCLPNIAVWITGICLCLQYKKHHPASVNLLTGAFILFIIDLLVITLLQSWIISSAQENGVGSITWRLGILQLFGTLINLIGWGLILTAIYQLLKSTKPL